MTERRTRGRRTRWGRAVLAAALFALLWWALTEGAVAWVFGAVVVAVATVAAFLLAPNDAPRLSLAAVPRFLGFFVYESVRGGLDVARRALHPRLPLAPGLLEYRLRLPPGPARIFLVNVVSLLPGTLSADLGETDLTVHVLDHRRPVLIELQTLERHIAALFGMELDPVPEAP